MKVPVVIVPADYPDLDQVREIFQHYVLNTVASFVVQEPPEDYILSRYKESRFRDLPYLVAKERHQKSKIVGYAYASPFRGSMLGYGHTVEISVFCHPDYVGKGVGNELMSNLLRDMKMTTHVTKEVGHEENKVEFEIKEVIAIMAVDESAKNQGLALRDWYKKWDFEEVGRLKGVGFKNGKSIDTIYLQLHLGKWSAGGTDG